MKNPSSAQFFHPLSYKFIVLGLLVPYPILSGFGLRFVTLQDVKGRKCFFLSSLGWSVICLNLKGRKCNYPKNQYSLSFSIFVSLLVDSFIVLIFFFPLIVLFYWFNHPITFVSLFDKFVLTFMHIYVFLYSDSVS